MEPLVLVTTHIKQRGGLFEAFRAKGLASPPGSRISSDLALLIVDNDGRRVGFHREPPCHIAGWYTVTVGVELEPDILVYERFSGVAIVGSKGWQSPEAIGPETLFRLLASFTVDPDIGDLIQPLAHL